MSGGSRARRRHAWLLLCLAPLGLGVWVPLVAGLRARRPLWVALGVAFCALTLFGWTLSTTIPDDQDGSLAGLFIVLPWAAAAATTLAIYPSYRRRRELLGELELREQRAERRRMAEDLEAQQRAKARERARALVARDPLAALERGVGRPDVAGADHGDLVDVNHAPLSVLETLPGVDPDVARRIVATRENVGRFSSVADMAFVLDLEPDTTARLERVAIAIDA